MPSRNRNFADNALLHLFGKEDHELLFGTSGCVFSFVCSFVAVGVGTATVLLCGTKPVVPGVRDDVQKTMKEEDRNTGQSALEWFRSVTTFAAVALYT
jgi:hypothetical protein